MAAKKKKASRSARAKVWSPLDTSHSPFKRMAKIGPGPRGRAPIAAEGRYVCKRGKPVTKDGVRYSVQLCADAVTGKTRKIKTNREWKKEYNSEYSKNRINSAASNTYRAGFKPAAKAKLYEAGQESLKRRAARAR